MTRKRSKFRPNPRGLEHNPMKYVTDGFKLAKDVQGDYQFKQQLVVREAIESIKAGTATQVDLGNLVAAYNMAAALMARCGHGAEHSGLLAPWRAATLALAEKECRGATTEELSAVAAGLDLLDAQLSIVTLDEVIAAANTLRNVKGLT